MKLELGHPQQVGMSERRVRYIASLAEGWVAQGITPALVVLAARRGVIVLHEAFGRLTSEPDSPPLEPDTIFPLISMGTTIAATAAMILVEEGLLGLNRPVQWYIPEFVGEGKESVMVRHLLTHTSGFRYEDSKQLDMTAFAEKKERIEIPPPESTQHPLLHEFLHLRYDVPLGKPPGVEMNWNTFNYDLLGEIVRRISGVSFADFCRERIFAPLGMVDTHYIVPESVRQRVFRFPADYRGADLFATLKFEETPWAGNGAYSTAMDVAIFGQMFLNRGIYGDIRILSPASVVEMTRNQIPGISTGYGREFFPEASWGFGWNVHGNKRDRTRGTLHSAQAFLRGSLDSFLLWVDPVYEIVGVYLSIELGAHVTCQDLFMNAVTAALVDV